MLTELDKRYRVVKGNLITKALAGEFDVIAHGCNAYCTMGAGIAPQMAKAFGADKFPMELRGRGDVNKLGQIDYETKIITKLGKVLDEEGTYFDYINDKKLTIVNCYTQFMYGANHKDGVQKPVDYDAIRLCMRKINYIFKEKHIGLPYVIGCGLAGGDTDKVIAIIQEELVDMNVTMVNING